MVWSVDLFEKLLKSQKIFSLKPGKNALPNFNKQQSYSNISSSSRAALFTSSNAAAPDLNASISQKSLLMNAPDYSGKFTKQSAVTDSFYTTQFHPEHQQHQRSVRTSTSLIPDQGSVSLTPVNRTSTKTIQSYQQIIPQKTNNFRSKSAETPSVSNNDEEFRPDGSIKSITKKFEIKNKDFTKPLSPLFEQKAPNKTAHFNFSPNYQQMPEKELIFTKTTTSTYTVTNQNKKFDKFGNEVPAWVKLDEDSGPIVEEPLTPDPVRNQKASRIEDYIPFDADSLSGAPRINKKLPPIVKKREGQAVKLEVEVCGVPEPQVAWYKDGILVRNSPDTRLTSNFGLHTLIIPEAFNEDSGIYKAVVTSPLGALESFCQLIVEGFEVFAFIYFKVIWLNIPLVYLFFSI